jgi:two-component sensor histidine kinase
VSGDCGGNSCGGRGRGVPPESRAEVRAIDSSKLVIDSSGKPCVCTKAPLVGDEQTAVEASTQKLACVALEASLREKELLIREIHHRVKNNLQVISSLLSLQGRASTSPEAQQACEESQLRIKSIALIHELLYRSECMTRIGATEYVEKLGTKLLSTFGIGNRVSMRVESSTALIDLDHAVPFGLVVNELMTNAMKHAFPGERVGVIRIGISDEESARMRFEFSDDGIGLPEAVDPATAQSLGFRLMASLIQQLDGRCVLDRSGGTKFLIDFPVGR